jgi:preprotein translocase subunit SecG
MTIFLTTLHVMVCLILIVVVLLQRGKGAEIGAVFGGGASTTIFGSRGAGNFLTRLTTGAAIVFMATSLLLAYFARERAATSVFDEPAPPAAETPAPDPGTPEGGGFQEVQPAPVEPQAPAPAPAPSP